MGSECGEVEVVVRAARQGDEARRAAVVRRALAAPLWDAFLYFYFQEVTLECCVLGGAVLFIFCGASAWAAAATLPAAAVFVLLTTLLAGQALAAEQAQKIKHEIVGLVAEVRGPLVTAAPPRLSVRLAPLAAADTSHTARYTQIVGTVSVSEMRGAYAAGWLHALAVDPQWRGAGVGRALQAGARRAARAAGLGALHAAATQLQPAARALLHSTGWECSGAYARPICGAALSLPVVRFQLDLESALHLA